LCVGFPNDAIASETPESLEKQGIAGRFVVASPSSYAYFDALRPGADGPRMLTSPCALKTMFDIGRCGG